MRVVKWSPDIVSRTAKWCKMKVQDSVIVQSMLEVQSRAKVQDGGNAWGDLRDEMPEITRAEANAKAKIACELIYKRRATLKGKQSPQTRLGPLALLCLLTPSLNPPCYNRVR